MALLIIWRDNQIEEQLANVKRNNPIYNVLADCLQRKGYERTAEQCRSKLKALKHDYNVMLKQERHF